MNVTELKVFRDSFRSTRRFLKGVWNKAQKAGIVGYFDNDGWYEDDESPEQYEEWTAASETTFTGFSFGDDSIKLTGRDDSDDDFSLIILLDAFQDIDGWIQSESTRLKENNEKIEQIKRESAQRNKEQAQEKRRALYEELKKEFEQPNMISPWTESESGGLAIPKD